MVIIHNLANQKQYAFDGFGTLLSLAKTERQQILAILPAYLLATFTDEDADHLAMEFTGLPLLVNSPVQRLTGDLARTVLFNTFP